MTDGMEIQEVQEAPQESKDVLETKEQLDRAAFEPEAAVEKSSDFKEAEAVEAAFVDSVPLVQVADSGRESPPATDTSTSEEIDAASREADEAGSAAQNQAAEGELFQDEIESGQQEGQATQEHIQNMKDMIADMAAIQQDMTEAALGISGRSSDTSVSEPSSDDVSTDSSSSSSASPESTEGSESSGKSIFGSESPSAADHYSGVEMSQGEVVQDSDMNEGYAPSMRADFSSDTDASTKDGTTVDLVDNQELNTGEPAGEDPVATVGEDLVSRLDQDQNTDTVDTDETGELDKNQIAIPASDGQIDFAGVAGEVQKTDDFTWKLAVAKDETGDFRIPSLHPTKIEPLPDRTASGDHLETSGDAAIKAETAAGEIDNMASDQAAKLEEKESIRDEQDNLQDELTFSLEEGSILVNGAEAYELTPDSIESEEVLETELGLQDGQEIDESTFAELSQEPGEILKEFAFDQERYDMLKSELDHYDGIILRINNQIHSLEHATRHWGNYEVREFRIDVAEKQSDGTYIMIKKVVLLTQASIHAYIAAMKATRDQVIRDSAPIRNELDEMKPVNTSESMSDEDREALREIRKWQNEQANQEAQAQADAAKNQEP